MVVTARIKNQNQGKDDSVRFQHMTAALPIGINAPPLTFSGGGLLQYGLEGDAMSRGEGGRQVRWEKMISLIGYAVPASGTRNMNRGGCRV